MEIPVEYALLILVVVAVIYAIIEFKKGMGDDDD